MVPPAAGPVTGGEEPQAVVQRQLEAYNQHDLDASRATVLDVGQQRRPECFIILVLLILFKLRRSNLTSIY